MALLFLYPKYLLKLVPILRPLCELFPVCLYPFFKDVCMCACVCASVCLCDCPLGRLTPPPPPAADVPNPPSLTNVECNPRSAYLGWASTGDNNAKLQGFVIQYRTRLHPEWKDAKNQIPAADTSFTVSGLEFT